MSNWQNRIIEATTTDPTQLLANPLNWRIHPRAQQDALQGVLEEIGWVQDIIVNRRTGHVLDGHLRVTLAMRYGESEVPIKLVDLSEDEERLVLATFDPIGAQAGTDKNVLGLLLDDLQAQDSAVQTMLEDMSRQVPALFNDDTGLGDFPKIPPEGDAVAIAPGVPVPESASELSANDDRSHVFCPKCGFEFAT